MAKLGVIAGSGRFPFLVVEEARRQGLSVLVAAIREEAEGEWGKAFENDPEVAVHWLALGQLGKLLKLLRRERVSQALMVGQVKHSKIFQRTVPAARRILAARPDWRMLRLLASLPRKNTAALIGGVIQALEQEGIEFLDPTFLLRDLLPQPGVLTRRPPDASEQQDIDYGRPVARQLARLDLGQTIVVRDQAVVAVEAMEGTDETIRRAARLTAGQPLTVIKVSRPDQDMRFDVPVLGGQTLEVCRECRVTALSIDAGRTVLLDRREFLAGADRLKMAVVAHEASGPERS